MTESQAKRIAEQALSCPFCGENLVVKRDQFGLFYVAHKDGPSKCFFTNVLLVAQLLNEDDLRKWNTRYWVPGYCRHRQS